MGSIIQIFDGRFHCITIKYTNFPFWFLTYTKALIDNFCRVKCSIKEPVKYKTSVYVLICIHEVYLDKWLGPLVHKRAEWLLDFKISRQKCVIFDNMT